MSSLIPWARSRREWADPFGSDLWDPFSGSGLWLWDTSGRHKQDETSVLAQARVDWRETDKAHIFTAELPGVRKEEVKVEVEDGNVLKISGESTKEEEQQGDKWHRVERRRGSFMRRFQLPPNANMKEVRCSLDHGVLTVTVPKLETESKPPGVRSIEVA